MSYYYVSKENEQPFFNHAHECIGTGRMDLALHKEYIDQLRLVQEKIGFEYIRGHGLFCKDMAIYQEMTLVDGTVVEEYNFTYLDQVMDTYQELGLRPFLELGFMPEKMASGNDTVFYWRGNITPPADYNKWARLVQATLRHLMTRYGEEEVLTWPIEVWNEPNLASFWKDADMNEYFQLYKVTVRAVKEVHEGFCVGGPAICGVDDERWLREFLDYVKDNRLPLDMVTRHHYTSYVPDWEGHYGYIELHEPSYAFGELERSRDIVDEYEEFRGMDIHITEFNTSYIPNAPIHDTTLNASYVAHMLSRLGDKHASYSYWTFGDVFEEKGVPFTPFHGGFGLVANGCIPKPTFWTFSFFKELKGKCIHRAEEIIVMLCDDGSYYGVAWNVTEEGSLQEKATTIELALPEAAEGDEYLIVTRKVDERHGNPLRSWHEMGEPATPTREQQQLLRDIALPQITTINKAVWENKLPIEISFAGNGVASFCVSKVHRQCDAGYHWKGEQ